MIAVRPPISYYNLGSSERDQDGHDQKFAYINEIIRHGISLLSKYNEAGFQY